MDGVLHSSHANLGYCCNLIQEYGILDTAQLYTLLKRAGQLEKRQRNNIVNGLYVRGFARRITLGSRSYYIKGPGITPIGKHHAQIVCFWVLLDYIHRVDSHHATGTYSRISMEIDGRDYDIVYVKNGEERLCNANMRAGDVLRYFVVVEGVSQIPLIKGDNVHTFATVSEQGKVEYFRGVLDDG